MDRDKGIRMKKYRYEGIEIGNRDTGIGIKG